MSKWLKLAGLSSWQWRVLLSAPFVFFLIWFRLRSVGFQQALTAVKPAQPSQLGADEQLSVAGETAYALAVALKYGPGWPRCLLRSLTLGWYLGRLGVPFEIRLGVPRGQVVSGSTDNSDFSAHAWVEHAGVVLNDKPDIAHEFVPFDA